MRTSARFALLAASCSLGAPGVGLAQAPPVEFTPTAPSIGAATVDMSGAMGRHDFGRGNQFLWGAIGGVGGSLLLGAVGAGVGSSLCIGKAGDCGQAVAVLAFVGLSAGLIAGPLVAINATGGSRADGWTHAASVGGSLLGLTLAGAVGSLLPLDIVSEGELDAPAVLTALGFVTLVGAGAGLGAAWGYQAGYPEIQRFTVAPMILPEGGGGLVFGGRF